MVVSWQERAKAFEKVLASYESHLASNDTLSDAEVTEIEYTILRDINGEEHAIEQEMARLQAQLADLQSRKNVFTRLSAACRKLISPIRHLPADLLLEVFKIRFAEDSAENGHAGRYRLFYVKEGPWLFSHVCSHWRRVMLSFPNVWSNFVIDRRAPNNHYMFHLELVLERSQAHPLEFSFVSLKDHSGALSTDFDQGWNEMLSALIPTSPRWKNVALILNSEAVGIMASVCPLALPILEKIGLTLTRFPGDGKLVKAAPGLLGMLSNAPKLAEVAFGGTAFDPVTSMHLPLAQLTRLAIETDYGDEAPDFPQLQLDINLLQACTSLTSFDMSYFKWTDGQIFLAEQIITHSTLSSFTISDTALLPSFNFPSLVNLSIKPHKYAITEPTMAQDLYLFLRRTQCKLQKLSFRNLDCATTSESEFHAILRDFGKTLTQLGIHYDGSFSLSESVESGLSAFWCSIFGRLVVDDPATVVLPALENFTMTLVYQDIAAWEIAADFIESRWALPRADVVRLKKFVFGAVDSQGHFMYIPPRCREQYERFKEEGLDIEIWTRTRFPRPKEPKKTVLSAFGGEAWEYPLV